LAGKNLLQRLARLLFSLYKRLAFGWEEVFIFKSGERECSELASLSEKPKVSVNQVSIETSL
jgi:hypothetical protein